MALFAKKRGASSLAMAVAGCGPDAIPPVARDPVFAHFLNRAMTLFAEKGDA
jgi:hypothetical protein